MKFLITVAVALGATMVNAATRVVVIELGANNGGASGTVRRTTSNDLEASVDGVASFWSALHGYGRNLQHAGMPVVPDLFTRPDGGVVLGLSGSIDLDAMPTLKYLLNVDNNDNDAQKNDAVVGQMEVPGHQCKHMMGKVKNVESVDSPSSVLSQFKAHAQESGISGLHMDVSSSNASEIDAQIAELIRNTNQSSLISEGKTVILHLVVEEDDGPNRRRTLARRLEQAEGENADNNGQERNQQNNVYYGYGYFNSYGEWVTPYKTMFQIQYFNVVLWTSLGLVAILFFSIYLMVYMPLMADTLLFGESAKVNHDD
jgi:hypothetical protein